MPEERFSKEARRLYGVLDKRLAEVPYLAGEYSIADIATWPWISRFEWQQIDLSAFPNLARWYAAIAAREAVQKGYHVPKKVGDIPHGVSPGRVIWVPGLWKTRYGAFFFDS